MTGGADRHQREVALHRDLAKEYELRYGREFARRYQRHWNEVLIGLVPADARSVLDAGCGTGVLLEQLVERFEHVTGLDLSPEMLARVPPEVAARAALLCAPLESVELPDHSFDAVICRGVLHHLPDIDAGLARLARLLRPGGSLVLSEPCADSLLLRGPRWYWRRFTRRFESDHHAIRSRELGTALEAAGFRVSARRKFGFVAFPLCSMSDILPVMRYVPRAATVTQLLINIDELLARVPIVRNESWHLIVHAERFTRPGSQ